MADQAKEGPQQPGPATNAGQDVLRLNQEAVPLPPVENDPLAEAARHFRELQAKSAGLAGGHMPSRAGRTGDTAREPEQDKNPFTNPLLSATDATCPQTEPVLPADTLSQGNGAAARITPRIRLRPMAKPETVADGRAVVDEDAGLPPPPPLAGAPISLTTKDMQPSALSSLVADVRPSLRADTPALPDDGPVDAMKRATALAANAPLLASSLVAGELTSNRNGVHPAAKPLPETDRKRHMPTGSSSNLRLFAGLSVIIAAFAGSLVWVALWRADSFNGRAEATLDVSPEDLVQTSAGSDGTDNGNAGGATTLMVRDTELLLARLAFDPGPADGVLDDTTRGAIERYQQAAGLPETGEPSKELLEELQAVAGAIDGH